MNPKIAINTKLAALATMLGRYGWTVNVYSDEGFELNNRNKKHVVTVKIKGERYQMFDTGGNKLMSGTGQLVTSCEKLMTQYYYCQPIIKTTYEIC